MYKEGLNKVSLNIYHCHLFYHKLFILVKCIESLHRIYSQESFLYDIMCNCDITGSPLFRKYGVIEKVAET